MIDNKKKIVTSAIIFDIGDTLLDATNIAEYALNKTSEYLERRKFIKDRTKFIEIYKNIDKQTEGPKINHLFSDIKIIQKTLEEIGFDSSPSILGLFIGMYRNIIRQEINRNDELIQLFSKLKNDGYKIGIISDGTTIEQIEQLHKLGIIEFIDTLVTSEEIGFEKPNKIIFEKALSDLSVQNVKNVVMVGDDVERDINGAKSVGMKTILITKYSKNNKPSDIIKADVVLDSIFDITKYLEELVNE